MHKECIKEVSKRLKLKLDLEQKKNVLVLMEREFPGYVKENEYLKVVECIASGLKIKLDAENKTVARDFFKK